MEMIVQQTLALAMMVGLVRIICVLHANLMVLAPLMILAFSAEALMEQIIAEMIARHS